MSYRADKLVLDGHTDTRTDTHTHAGNDTTRRPKLASGKKVWEPQTTKSRTSIANFGIV